MEVRNNYNECLTNLACSIRKYFELEYKHNTIDYIDKILNENKPKNVVTILWMEWALILWIGFYQKIPSF